jgi:hypothetical protein
MFTAFSKAVDTRFKEMSKGELFVVDAPDIFEQYLAAFPAGSDPVFRTRTEHDCQCCKHFLRRLGIVVSVKNGEMITLFSDLDLPAPYNVVAEKLDSYIRSRPIESVFRTKERSYGMDHNYDKQNQRYDHFYGKIDNKHYSYDKADTLRGEKESVYKVFKRGLTELNIADIDTVIDLIDSNGLYRGEEHKQSLSAFRKLMLVYKESENKDLFIWEHLNERSACIRNTVIGTLLVDLADGKDIDVAVKSFETKVAPANYKRPTSVITQKMVESAIETLNTMGLGGAIYRRYAKLSDVSVNDVLFVDNDVKNKMKDGIATLLESSIKQSKSTTKNSITISADDFITKVLPTARNIELLLENRHLGNFVTLTGSDGSERIFKWNNNFAWSYDGDVTDSVKQRVKAAGGNIHADIRVSLSWFNFDDLDLHAKTPDGKLIYYADKQGILDVDMNAGSGTTRTPVENLAFVKPKSGVYKISVDQFHRRETIDFGFSIEIENDGVLQQYSYSKALRDKEHIDCFTFTVKGGKVVDIKTNLVGGDLSQEKWGLKTQTLIPVTSIMYSPNHWGENKVGAKHLIFALKNCKNDKPVRGIYNEFLRSDLEKHRKVFEVLGSKTKCQPTEDQISGVGFTSARGDSVSVNVNNRSYLVTF